MEMSTHPPPDRGTMIEHPTSDASTDRITQQRPLVGWPELGIAVLVALALYAVGILAFLQVPADQPILAGLAQYAVSGLAPLGGFAAAVLLRIRDVRPFGLRRVSGRWLLVAVGVGVVVIGLNLLTTSIVVMTMSDVQNVQTDYQAAATGGLASFLAAIALGAVLTPIGEEFLFRGVLANALSRFGPWVAVLGSSLIFALAHGVNVVMPVAFIVGVAAVLMLRKTGSIWPCVIIHACNNANSVILPALFA